MFDLVLSQVEQSRNEARLPAGVVITGGSANLPNITNIAKKVFGVPARVGYPQGLGGLVDELSSPAFAVSQGLVLYGSQNESMYRSSIDMLGSKSQSKSSGGMFSGISKFFKNLMP